MFLWKTVLKLVGLFLKAMRVVQFLEQSTQQRNLPANFTLDYKRIYCFCGIFLKTRSGFAYSI